MILINIAFIFAYNVFSCFITIASSMDLYNQVSNNKLKNMINLHKHDKII